MEKYVFAFLGIVECTAWSKEELGMVDLIDQANKIQRFNSKFVTDEMASCSTTSLSNFFQYPVRQTNGLRFGA